MHPAAFLALLTIAMLAFGALRLELDFRRTAEAGPGRDPRGNEPDAAGRAPQAPGHRPELRAPPAGGYWQAPFSRAA
ncbi:MAG TPA: hypothetical protein VE891_09805 [Allosphingosinicella sp.]|nr:hypothetical protein [Allosphingosinicella sp.]